MYGDFSCKFTSVYNYIFLNTNNAFEDIFTPKNLREISWACQKHHILGYSLNVYEQIHVPWCKAICVFAYTSKLLLTRISVKVK